MSLTAHRSWGYGRLATHAKQFLMHYVLSKSTPTVSAKASSLLSYRQFQKNTMQLLSASFLSPVKHLSNIAYPKFLRKTAIAAFCPQSAAQSAKLLGRRAPQRLSCSQTPRPSGKLEETSG